MAESRRTPEPTALESAATGLVDRARSGQVLTPRAARWLGIGLVALLAVGIYFYLQSANRKAASRTWADFTQPGLDLADYAAKNKDTEAGKIARLERARQQYGPQGVAAFAGSDRAARLKGIENVIAARDEFVKLAETFSGDKTLAATCYLEAADAELALVGIPKDAASPDYHGTVAGAVAFLNQAVAIVGESSAIGETLKARAAKLESSADTLLAAGLELNSRFSPPPPLPSFTAPTPGTGTEPFGGILPPLDGPTTPTTSRSTIVTPTTQR